MMKKLTGLILASTILLSGCAVAPDPTGTTAAPTQPTVPWEAEKVGSFEPETGKTIGTEATATYVTGFDQDGDACELEISVPADGFYDLEFVMRTDGGFKQNYVFLDGEKVADVDADGKTFKGYFIRRVYMSAGTHQLSLVKFWGYVDWEKLNVWTSEPFDESIYNVSAKLVNPNASENAKRLFSYLCDNYGKHILTGQQCDSGMMGWEMRVIEQNTGKYPAVMGLDMMDYSPSRVEHGSSSKAVDLAIAYWEKCGGISTFCWHWNVPSKYIRPDKEWHGAFYTEYTTIDLSAVMGGEDPQGYDLLVSDIDAIAVQLRTLADAGVPILWRPLHEASGGWFWWGSDGPEAYRQLYYLMYDRLVNYHGLNNLIWVWNGQNGDWYPGDEYVDIIGQDIYPGERVYTSQMGYFLSNQSWADGNKMVVLSENGCMIDPELAVRDRAMWGYFCTWSGTFVMTDGTVKRYSEQYTEIEMLKKIYDSEVYISRDELPDIREYPIRDDA